ncbi:hypothetical protein LEP1GSC005_0247 [Leptospira santarosai str. ST188]|nr:hypothetical protein LEP1GSC068_3806 [Leptospira sp. Fiocruz LV3954]EMF92179.1 hypothetical protein LEP1GSC005_0247 [Leptospira santarosai str. ST188]EMI62466.1 hypothetical protein LEP1GSC076_3883 [Leptospira sp. Fiocruz LV4135]EMJ45963.1 hypothetical protein LEP1GSC169_0111 [Leptospira santarosai str. HAI1349]EMM76765.1 hypothetical protein LEP1GSC040_1019 [Leptospira santarosai str. 2000030832]EMO14725.1 hypothetical protein LEP1GSC165_2604 [Leptospira santarosai str. CBC523]EMO85564.1 
MGTPARLKRFLTFLDRIHLKSNYSGEPRRNSRRFVISFQKSIFAERIRKSYYT